MRKEQRAPRKPVPAPGTPEARQAARRKRRIRRRIIRMTIVLTVLLLLALIIALVVLRISGEIAHKNGSTTSFMAVKAIEVEGDTRYTDEEIIAASGIYVGESLLVVNKVEAHNTILAAFPYLDAVDVGNASFSTIRIQVRETPVMGVVETSAGYMVLGENNHALELITDETALPTGAVRIRGAALVNETVGQPLLEERALNVCATLLVAARENGLTDLTLIDLTERTNICLMWKDQIQVVLGNESNLPLQIKALKGVLPTLLGNNGEGATGRLDMSSYADDDSSNDRSVFSPMTREELAGTTEEEPTEDAATEGMGDTDGGETSTTASVDTAATTAAAA